jgi:hypothetical protein
VTASCKVSVVVPAGGSVTTQSGAYSCAAGKTCNIDVLDIYFDQTFVAKPATGYQFKSWKKANRRFCGGSSKSCRLFTSGFSGNDLLMSFLATNEVFYLQPEFEKIANVTSNAGTLYVSGQNGRDIASVNPANGSIKASFSSGLTVGMTDLEFVKGQLYGLQNYGSALYKINFASGSTSKIGNTGVTCDPTCSLFTLNGKLYILDFLSRVFLVNLNTGFATATGIRLPGQVVTHDGSGTLSVLDYGFRGNYNLHTFDLSTKSIRRTVTISNPGSYDFSDMAYTKNGLIAIARAGGALAKINVATGTATGYAATGGNLFFYNGMTSY